MLLTAIIFLGAGVILWMTGATGTGHLLDDILAVYFIGWGLYALFSTLPRREIRIRFVLMTGGILAVVGVVELVGLMGVVNFQQVFGTHGRAWFDREGFIPDTELGYRRKPYSHTMGAFVRGNIGEALCLPAHEPTPFELHYDQFGFRNDHDVSKADLVVIGDSYVESPMLPAAHLFTTRLRELLGISVVNLGMSGYGPEEELVVLKRFALLLQPKTIVWTFFEGNDLQPLNPDVEDREPTASAFSQSRGDAVWMRSFLRNALMFLKHRVEGCQPHAVYLQYRGVFRETAEKTTDLYFWDQAALLKPTDRLRLERLKSILSEAAELCRKRGIRFVVAFAPVKYRVHRGLPNFTPTAELAGWAVSDLPQEIERIVRALPSTVGFVDLTPGLRTAASQGVLTYIPDDTHWTAEGQHIVGHVLYQALMAGSSSITESMESRLR